MGEDEIIEEEPDHDDEELDPEGSVILAQAYKSVLDKLTDKKYLPFLGNVRKRRVRKLKQKYAIARALDVPYVWDLFRSELEIEAAVNRDRVNVLIEALKSIIPSPLKKRKKKRGVTR